MHTMIRMALATAVFGAVHSALASNQAKRAARRLAGERRADSCYRLFFVGQSALSVSLLLRYGARLPRRTIYHIRGPAADLLHAGQLWALLELARTASQANLARLSGWTHARAIPGHCAPALPPPVAQGPELAENGKLCDGAAYRWSRHPLNFLGVPIFWLTPHLTTRRLAFNLVSTVYFMLGSWHEEVRLKAAYGEPYLAYCRSGVPFFWPRLFKGLEPAASEPERGGFLRRQRDREKSSEISPVAVVKPVDKLGSKSLSS